MNGFRATLVAATLALGVLPAFAQTYPAKPIRVVSTQTAGSPADALMRITAQKMSESVGQPVIVDVVAGAAGVLAAQTVARAAPDGYTLLYTLPSTMVITPQLMKARPFELKDFTPIIMVSRAATCMLASMSFPPNSVKALIEHARANPGRLAYGTNGIGGIYHLEMETLKQKYGLDLTHVPYKAGVDAMMAAAAGTLPIAYAPCGAALAQARAGKLKVLAVLEPRRLPDLPDLPAMGEQVEGYEKMPGGNDIYGPAGIPAPVAKRLHAELDRALAAAEVRAKMKDIAFYYDGTALEQMGVQRRKDFELAARAIRVAGLKPE